MGENLFIRGGWIGHKQPRIGRVNTGLPSRFWGAFFPRYSVRDQHTAYEWAMLLGDRHPYPAINLFGEVRSETVAGMNARERALEGYADQINAIYREMKIEFEAGRLDPLRREWCTDLHGTLDFTRCIFSRSQVLSIVARRGDTGWLINKLFASATPHVAAVSKPPIPRELITQWLEDTKKAGNGIPSQREAVKAIRKKYPKYDVTRQPVIDAHRLAFPGTRPGRR